MHVFADYHTHTVYSHGTGTVEENVVAAIERGLREVAISEHASANMFYGVSEAKLRELRKEIDRMNRVYGGRIRVLMGLEANLLAAGTCDMPKDEAMLDFALLGYHRGIFPKSGFALRAIFETAAKRGNGEKNAEAMLATLEANRRVTMVAHPGLYIPMDIRLLAKGCGDLGVALEINAHHVSMIGAELQTAAAHGAKFVIGSDAHTPNRVGDVKRAIAAAAAAGLGAGDIINAE